MTDTPTAPLTGDSTTETMTPSRDIARLIEIMARLRTPVSGCPWDLEQTFATIAPYTIEEAYEVADAIERGNLHDLADELGDLLLQVVYHARMAEEQAAFSFGDVVHAVTAKMIRRHPHVFGSPEQRAAGAGPDFWARIKAEEKALKDAAKTQSGPADGTTDAPPTSILDGVPATLPALTRAVKLQDKAARVGFDWPSLAPVFAKLREEVGELEAVISQSLFAASDSPSLAASDSPSGSRPDAAGEGQSDAAIREEFGDMLFVMANIARHLQIDPEAALRAANQKFVRRFQHIEARLSEQGRRPEQSTLEEMDRYWDEVRAADKVRPPDGSV